MSDATLVRSPGPGRLAIQGTSEARCGMAPHRGDVTTVRAAILVGLRQAKHVETLQAHAPSHRTAGTAAVPVVISGIGKA